MIAYGWTEAHVREACAYASDKIMAEDGVPIELKNMEVKTHACQRGNATLSFSLGFLGSTARRGDGSYPAGSAYTTHVRNICLPTQPIPTAEVQNMRTTEPLSRGREYELRTITRSTSGLCWHTFGHFMAKLFDLNAAGRLVTGANIYDGRRDFEHKADRNKMARTHDCDCAENGLMSFMQVSV